MSDYKHKVNSGSLFRNTKKNSDKQPDYTGTVNVDGKILRIAGWLKGEPKYLSLAFSEPREQRKAAPASGGGGDTGEAFVDDDVPFITNRGVC